MVKHALAVIVATAIGMLCITFIRIGLYLVYPLPGGTDLYDAESASKALANMPQAFFILLLAGCAVSSFIAGIAATIISKRIYRTPAIVTAFFITAGGIINVLTIHHPMWFSITSCLVYIPFVLLGYLVSRKKGTHPS